MARLIESEIEINASAECVWDILTAFNKYPDWNPFIRSIKGDASPGAELNVQIQPAHGKKMAFNPMVVSVNPKREFSWMGHILFQGLFDGNHIFRIIPIKAGQVRFIHTESFSGLLSAILFKLIGDDTHAGFVAMNHALKIQAEDRFKSERTGERE